MSQDPPVNPAVADAIRPWRPGAWPLGAVLLVAGLLRLWHLGDWSLGGDEIETLHEAERLLRPDQVMASRPVLVSGPLLHLMVRALLPWFGDPVFTLRLVPLLCGVLSLAVAFLGVRRLYGDTAAFATALLMAFSPLHFYVSTFGRYYAPVFLCGTLALMAVLRYRELGQRRSLGTAALWFLLGAGFHVSILLTALVTFGAVLALRRSRRGFLVVAGVAVVGALALPFLGTEVGVLSRIVGRVGASYPGLGVALSLAHDLGIAIPVLALLGLAACRRDGNRSGALLGIVAVVPALLLMLLSGAVPVGPRYVYGAMPAVYLLAGLGLAQGLRPLGGQGVLRVGLLGLALIPPLPVLLSQCIDNSRHDIKGIAVRLEAERQVGEPVFAEAHAITRYYTGLPCIEMPATRQDLIAALPSDRRAFLVMLLQRGQALGTSDRGLQQYVESHFRLIDRIAPKRLDMHRFETRLYLWEPPDAAADGAAPVRPPPPDEE